ncbi:DUF3152 domain-containing protein [Micromonospora sp. KC606]|uniref:DUF3152 domain-containing protein n=1 Tax=Micromonospora sp. KC606 TaxID=2530379 RepID=UPI001FB849A4|nr:DUF3152 domain-containing protein [Micromonospora sp. KC606]
MDAFPSSEPTRQRRPRGRTALGVLVAVGATAATVAVLRPDVPPAVPPAVAPTGYGLGAGARATPFAGYPTGGPGRFNTASGRSPVRGHDGPLRRYRVAVEEGSGQDVGAFAAAVDEVLGDPRSWIGSGELRVQRVPEVAGADFTIFLATPATSERMCAAGGLRTERYTSCRLPGQVIINLARWMEAVPDYGAPLETYRRYVVNHEVGHEFGEQHQACPGPGEPAPVMQQQTYGLDGCVANAWPYLDGGRYEGAPTDGV